MSKPLGFAFITNSHFRDAGFGASPTLTDPAEQATEEGKCRIPTLRNIALTAPYMHNGVYHTLEAVIRHYDITATDDLLFAPKVENNIAVALNYHTNMGLGLQPQDYVDLENFMLTLTDGFF